jgi:hypothetical protein
MEHFAPRQYTREIRVQYLTKASILLISFNPFHFKIGEVAALHLLVMLGCGGSTYAPR